MDFPIKALVADDDQTHREIFSDLMSDQGMEVEAVEDGDKAIEYIHKNHYDVILTDLMMPGRDGIEVLREARKKSLQTLVVIITGFGTLETAIEAIRLGAHDYITKPFKLEELQLIFKNVNEKINLMRSNRILKEQLSIATKEIELLKQRLDDSLAELAEAKERINDYEHNLSAVLSRFPFLLNSNIPLPARAEEKMRNPSLTDDQDEETQTHLKLKS